MTDKDDEETPCVVKFAILMYERRRETAPGEEKDRSIKWAVEEAITRGERMHNLPYGEAKEALTVLVLIYERLKDEVDHQWLKEDLEKSLLFGRLMYDARDWRNRQRLAIRRAVATEEDKAAAIASLGSDPPKGSYFILNWKGEVEECCRMAVLGSGDGYEIGQPIRIEAKSNGAPKLPGLDWQKMLADHLSNYHKPGE